MLYILDVCVWAEGEAQLLIPCMFFYHQILDNEDIWGSPPLGSVIADFTDVALPFNLPGSANPFSLLNISVQELFRCVCTKYMIEFLLQIMV